MSSATLDRPAVADVPFAFEPTRRHKFGSHTEMAHTWAACTVESGESADGRMEFSRGSVFSYGRHFEIARFLPRTVDGRRVVLFTNASYSVSTSKHIGHVRGALHGLDATVIPVPDLTRWQASPDQVAAVWETLIRRAVVLGWRPGLAYPEAEAFVALFAPEASMPSDPAAWVRERDAAIADARAVARLSDALAVLGRLDKVPTAYSRERGTARPLDTVDASLISSHNAPSDEIARRLKRVRSALVMARKFPEHADVVKAGNAFVKTWAAHEKAWLAAEEAAKFAREREARRAKVVEALAMVRQCGGMDLPWRFSGEMLRHYLDDACRLGFPAADVAELHRAVALEMIEAELTPPHLVPDWQAERFTGRKTITREDWQAGAGSAAYPRGGEAATMVRRKGDNLETSRGAVVPFRAAVAVYLRAARQRRAGQGWHANGEQVSVGHFRLDAITPDGSIVVGCHRIAFAEMERLAVREIPAQVVARFPLPAVLS